MSQHRNSPSLQAWALYPHGEFSGSRLQKATVAAGSFAFLCFGAYIALNNETTYDQDTALLQAAAEQDGFSLVGDSRVRSGQATVAIEFGRCLFNGTVVTVVGSDITSYDILVGGSDAYNRNQTGTPHFTRIENSADMPSFVTTDKDGQTVPCVDK